MRTRATSIAAVCGALSVVGCGGSDDTGDPADSAERGLRNAYVAGHSLCTYLSVDELARALGVPATAEDVSKAVGAAVGGTTTPSQELRTQAAGGCKDAIRLN